MQFNFCEKNKNKKKKKKVIFKKWVLNKNSI